MTRQARSRWGAFEFGQLVEVFQTRREAKTFCDNECLSYRRLTRSEKRFGSTR